jgi:hypothetical protein
VYAKSKSLLVRADFVLGKGGDGLVYHRWRRILAEALPRLLGCERRSPRAERIRLHEPEGDGRFTGWVRIPIERRPSRRRLRKFRDKLRRRLESSLQPLDGRVLKVGVRRLRPRLAIVTPALPFPAETARSA